MTKYRFNKEADTFLENLYRLFGARENFQKIKVIQTELGGDFNFRSAFGEVTEAMKLGCLEIDYLERMGKIEIIGC